MLTFIKSSVSAVWAPYHSKRSCFLLFGSQLLTLITLLCIGFIYVHVYLPNYNARRLSKTPLVCSTVSNEEVEECELPWNHSQITIEANNRSHRLYEEDGHSVSVSVSIFQSRDGLGDANSSSEQVVVTERHFTWSSCGEFCSEDFIAELGCRQIKVDVRRSGSNLKLEECTNIDFVQCQFPDMDGNSGTNDKRKKCFIDKGTSCLKLGLFQCQSVPSSVMTETERLEATAPTVVPLDPQNNNTEGPPRQKRDKSNPFRPKESFECSRIEHIISCDMASLDLHREGVHRYNCSQHGHNCFSKPGIYICDSETICKNIPNPDKSCTRNCDKMSLEDKNIIISNEYGGILTAKCSKAYRMITPTSKGSEVWPRSIKHQTDDKWKHTPPLLMNCNTMTNPGDQITKSKLNETLTLGDCFNGTRLENMSLPSTATFRDIQILWHQAMKTEDFLLDPINQMDASPSTNLSVFSGVPLYLNDFYKSKSGCELKSESLTEEFKEDCKIFYTKYGRLQTDLRGQSLFSCYCRNAFNSTYCVVGAGERDIFEHYWEDGLIEFVNSYYIVIICIFAILFIIGLVLNCVLLYPLITDQVPVPDNFVDVIGVSPTARSRSIGQGCGNSTGPVFTITRRSPSPGYLTPGPEKDGRNSRSGSTDGVKEYKPRSRSNSIISAMA